MTIQLRERRIKLLRTLNLNLMFLGLGMSIAIPGPTLLDLQRLVNTDSGHITLIYTARSGGYLLGSMFGGILLDKFNKEAVLVIFTTVMGISIASLPWWRRLSTLSVNILINGLATGCIDTGGNVRCLEMWSKESGAYLQVLHFSFGLGAFIAPLIVEPFLSVNSNQDDGNNLMKNSSLNDSYAPEDFALPNSSEDMEFPIRYAYGIVSGYIILISILSAVTFFVLPREKLSVQHEDRNKLKNRNLPLFITIMLLIALLMCIICGIEIGFGQLITTFAVKSDLHLSESVGSYMTSVYWGTYTFARFFSIFLVMCSNLVCPILFNLAIILLGSICLSLFGNNVIEVLWAGIALLGFGLSSMFPSVLAWLEHDIPFNSKVASMFVMGAALGEMVFPLSVGHFIDKYPISLMYSTFVAASSCTIIFAVVWRLSTLYRKKTQCKGKPTNVPSPSNEEKTIVQTQHM